MILDYKSEWRDELKTRLNFYTQCKGSNTWSFLRKTKFKPENYSDSEYSSLHGRKGNSRIATGVWLAGCNHILKYF